MYVFLLVYLRTRKKEFFDRIQDSLMFQERSYENQDSDKTALYSREARFIVAKAV